MLLLKKGSYLDFVIGDVFIGACFWGTNKQNRVLINKIRSILPRIIGYGQRQATATAGEAMEQIEQWAGPSEAQVKGLGS